MLRAFKYFYLSNWRNDGNKGLLRLGDKLFRSRNLISVLKDES